MADSEPQFKGDGKPCRATSLDVGAPHPTVGQTLLSSFATSQSNPTGENMARGKEPQASNGASQPPDVVNAASEDEGFKFTLNLKGKGESLTIRTNSETELESLREKWKEKLTPKNRELPKMLPGDNCPDETCTGHMVVKTTNGKPGQRPYAFLSCDQFPRCKRTAYINNEPKEEKIEAKPAATPAEALGAKAA
jgi:hypothetical protein